VKFTQRIHGLSHAHGTRRRSLNFESLEDRRLLAILPAGFTESVVAAGLTSPISLDVEPTANRVWVSYQDGRLGVIENDLLLPNPAYVLDADGSAERGFQSVKLDPDFDNNGYIYVYYSAASPVSHNRLSRLTVDQTTKNTILPDSEVVLLDLPNLSDYNNAIFHMGGAIHFDSSGKMLIQVGDHQTSGLSQNLNHPTGKVLRVNPDGTPATDNPFYNAADGISWTDYIWASGLRNPFSGDIDPSTGRYFINDVGQESWEEINEATVGGANFGWPTTEGYFNPATFPDLTNPVHAYPHGDGYCSITGGVFYSPQTTQFPSQYEGMYFFADFCAGVIRYIDPDNPAESHLFASEINYPLNMRVTSDGSMYYIARGAGAGGDPGVGTGQVVKVQFASQIAPQVVQQPADVLASVGYDATFTAIVTGSSTLCYQWQRFDGTCFIDIPDAKSATYTIENVSLADNATQLRVVVTNPYGSVISDVAILTVTTDTPPQISIELPTLGSTYQAGDTITFAGVATDMEDGELDGSSMTWVVDFHHDTHHHPFIPAASGISGDSFVVPVTGETAHNVWFRIHLSVTDSAGLTTSTFRDIFPLKSDFTVLTNFSGGKVLIDGQLQSPGTTTKGVVNLLRTLEAPLTQVSSNGDLATFIRWMDGETSSARTISTPAADFAYIALYANASDSLTFVSDLTPANFPPPNGFGPYEIDTSNGEAAAGDGNLQTIEGVTYLKGLGVHADSEIRYNLSGAFERFISDIGVDDEVASDASVTFQVFGDDLLLYDSGVMTWADPSQKVDLDVTGVQELRLMVLAGASNNSDHANWSNARLIANQTGPDIYINFQEETAPVPTGYLPDAGHVFGNRDNGYFYGWSEDHTDLDRARELHADQRLDTLLQFHAGHIWEIELPNGAYAVTVSIGDAAENSTHTLNVEGISFWYNQTLDANRFQQRTQLVTVNDGRLTLDTGDAAENATRINYIEIIPTSEPGLFAESFADFDQNGIVNGRDFLLWQRGFGLSSNATKQDGDADGDGNVDRLDLTIWASTYGQQVSVLVQSPAESTTISSVSGDGMALPISSNFNGLWGLIGNDLLMTLRLHVGVLTNVPQQTGQTVEWQKNRLTNKLESTYHANIDAAHEEIEIDISRRLSRIAGSSVQSDVESELMLQDSHKLGLVD
jgi:glucose/arabinose dehydrogenase